MYNIEQWPLTLYFDGECTLFAREIKILSRRAIEARLLFFDISSCYR
jgi:predicted DCC family thiol-disulfide oxidoreductase YuxK